MEKRPNKVTIKLLADGKEMSWQNTCFNKRKQTGQAALQILMNTKMERR